MKTLGQVLQTLREKQKLSIEQLARKSFVPQHVLESLENEQFETLPAAALVRGYIQLIAPLLEVSDETLLALYRRDVQEKKLDKSAETSRLQRRSSLGRWNRPAFLSPSRWFSFVMAGAILIAIGSVTLWQWQQLSQPPKLRVDQPEPFALVKSPVQVTGKTSPENTVTINTENVSLNPQGEFSQVLQIPPGERTLVVRATDSRGRSTDVILFVTVEEE
jgi:cytoskeletal protein RodZ